MTVVADQQQAQHAPQSAQQQAQAEYIAAAEAGMNSDSLTPYVAIDSLGHMLIAEFKTAEVTRMPTEQRWLKDLRQYRGIYDPEIEARIGKNRSKAFNRATRVKVKTVDARVADLLFPSGTERNWSIEPSKVPSLDEDSTKQIAELLTDTLAAHRRRRSFRTP